MRLAPEEPAAGPWRVEPLAAVLAACLQRAGPITGRALIVAIDGRSSSGKTTLAGRISSAVTGSAVVHTDDIAGGVPVVARRGGGSRPSRGGPPRRWHGLDAVRPQRDAAP